MKLYSIKYLILSALIIGGILSCVKDEFDEPPSGGEDPVISQDKITTLEEALAKLVLGESTKLEINKYVQAIVVADDESGNFFRQIIIEDENSDRGIALLIDDVELYNTYPVGRRVFVDLTELYIGDYNGLPQIGATPYDDDGFIRLAGIQSEIAKNKTVLPGVYGLEVIPTTTNVNLLGSANLNTLIRIENMQFKSTSAGVTYAISEPATGVNHIVGDCDGNDILLRTSGYSDFVDAITPETNGTLTAVYGVFGNDRQLMIRDLKDVEFTEPRCEIPTIPIAIIRSNFDQGANSAPSGIISGIVISDRSSGNVTGRNLFLQDETAGILVRFAGNHSFDIGSRLVIDVSSQELSEFLGLLQINNVPSSNVDNMGFVGLPDAQEVTIGQVLGNFENYESEYIIVKGASISGGSTYGGGLDVSDGSGTIDMFTQSGADFENDQVPSGTVDITAIVSIFNSPQLLLNGSSDVVGGTTGQGEGDLISISALRAEFNGVASTAPDGFIQGVVISDRANSNINSRNLVIQDESGGIVVRFTGDHSFSLGDEVKIIVSNQELSEFSGLLQVNNVSDSNAERIGTGILPTPTPVSVNNVLTDLEAYESTLISLQEVTISGNATFSGNTSVSDGTGSIDLYTSSSAQFANNAVPSEPVDMVAIASQFNDPQILIRNLNDIGGGGEGGELTIMGLRQAFESGASTAVSGEIEGVVISDYENENTTGRNLHIQDASGGITLRFASTHSFAVGTMLKVDVTGMELSEYNGLLQVNNLPNSNATSMGIVDQPDPKVITLSTLIADLEILESTLVRVNDVTLSGASTFAGNVNVTDATGMVVSFSREQATFANSALPTGTVDLIGIVTEFNVAQITIRNLNDIID